MKEIDWQAVKSDKWGGANVDYRVKEGKQAEFLVEKQFPWNLVQKIGVRTQEVCEEVTRLLCLNRDIVPLWSLSQNGILMQEDL